MPQNWESQFSENIRNYEGYSIGKLFRLLKDPEMISLAGGLPSPDTFLKSDLQRVTQIRLREDTDTIMQYTDTGGEINLIEAVIQFLKKDRINISKNNIVITSFGQQGLDLTGRHFLRKWIGRRIWKTAETIIGTSWQYSWTPCRNFSQKIWASPGPSRKAAFSSGPLSLKGLIPLSYSMKP